MEQTDGQTDRQTDGIAMANMRYSYAVARKNHGLGQYGAEPHYSTSPVWQLCALGPVAPISVNCTVS